MNRDFICVSGVTREEELHWISYFTYINNLDNTAIGFQVSNSSINKGTTGERQSEFSELKNLVSLSRINGITPAIHYFTNDNETVLGDLETIASNIDMSCGSTLLQFNTLPLETSVLKEVKKMGFDTIFKIPVSNKENERGYSILRGGDVQDVSSGEVAPLIEYAREVAQDVSYVMFDASHGTNLELDLSENSLPIRFGKGIRELGEMDNVGLVYAGGIGPDNVYDMMRTLGEYFPRGVSVDAESAVMSSDGLDRKKIGEYFSEAKRAK